MWYPMRQPRVVKHEVFGLVRAFMRQFAIHPSDLFRVAGELNAKFLEDQRNFKEALQTYLDVCETVRVLKNRSVGWDKLDVEVNLMIQTLSWLWISAVSVTEQDKKLCFDLTKQLKEAGQEWFHFKVFFVLQGVGQRLAMQHYVDSMAIPGRYRKLLAKLGTVTEIEASLTEFADAIRSSRKYGIKPAYFAEGFAHGPGQAWNFSDMAAGIRELGGGKLFDSLHSGIVSSVSLVNVEDLQEISMPGDPGWSGTDRISELVPENAPVLVRGFEIFHLEILESGELHLFPGGHSDVKGIFGSVGKEWEYLGLRAAQLMQLADLTVPLIIVNQSRVQPRGLTGAIRSLLGGPEQRLPEPRLLLERLRVLGDVGFLQTELEKEMEEDEERTKRRLRRHEVVGHTRRLPSGSKASPDAVAAAMKDGVPLEEDETYVSKHYRGSGTPSVKGPHRVVRRG